MDLGALASFVKVSCNISLSPGTSRYKIPILMSWDKLLVGVETKARVPLDFIVDVKMENR